MINLDQWILAIVAVIAVISPCVTAFINNKTQYKISKLNTLYTTKINYINEYFESLAAYITDPLLVDSVKNYSAASQKIYVICDNTCRECIDQIDSIIYSSEYYEYSDEFAKKLSPLMKKLSKNIKKCID